jgi:hypothetical protein
VQTLKKYGLESNNPLDVEESWFKAVDGAARWFQGSQGTNLVNPENYLQWYSKSQTTGGKKENLPTRQVYLTDPATVRELIDTTVQNVLGRKATKSEMDDFYGAINKMMQEGTVTTSKTRVMNGVKENVVTQKQGYSQQRAESMIEERLKAQAPEDYAQKKSLDFLDFLFGGGM